MADPGACLTDAIPEGNNVPEKFVEQPVNVDFVRLMPHVCQGLMGLGVSRLWAEGQGEGRRQRVQGVQPPHAEHRGKNQRPCAMAVGCGRKTGGGGGAGQGSRGREAGGAAAADRARGMATHLLIPFLEEFHHAAHTAAGAGWVGLCS